MYCIINNYDVIINISIIIIYIHADKTEKNDKKYSESKKISGKAWGRVWVSLMDAL